MRSTLLTSALLMTVLALVGCTRNDPDASTAAPVPPLTAIATTKQLMQAIVIPSSDIIFGVASEAPVDDTAWLVVQNNALALAEAGNLLMMNGRRIEQTNWLNFARQLSATASSAAQAAQDKDVDAVMETGNAVYEVCDGCHKQYMPARAGE